MLPFTAEVFFAQFAQYNAAIWPAQIVGYVLGLVAVVLIFRPTGWSDRLVAASLAIAWLWIGAVYHFAYFAAINFSAPVFGAVFILEGLLLTWTGVVRGRLAFRFQPGVVGWVGVGLIVLGMAIYPVLGWTVGRAWPRAAMFGVAPCPTTIFTLGLLLLVDGRTPLHLLAIPALWSLVAGTAVWFLGIPEDLVLPVAGLVALALAPWKNRRQRTGPGPGATRARLARN